VTRKIPADYNPSTHFGRVFDEIVNVSFFIRFAESRVSLV
jgi:hypothetical protein